ncbi:MAG TPA: crossover junction endodeoxyribonuclease RuvC [Bryobacterales bacterium]|nr:crossover junction endodeoxyribonuclease RuvC [Bryobacterales bacterium]
MRVLGIDCGCEKTGFGVVDTDGRAHRFVSAGVIRTSAAHPLAARLALIHEGLCDALHLYQPEVVAIEEVFHAANVKTALRLAHVRGIALLAAAQAGLPVGEYSPLEVKTSVVGYGRAEKHQVQTMVASLLALPEPLAEDASDALAVAICHATATLLDAKLSSARAAALPR